MNNKNNTHYQKANQNGGTSSDEWYTPSWITSPLGEFDLDPCGTPINPIAKHTFTKDVDGTQQDWSPYGRVWLNPPYSNPTPFIQKMCQHNNGIALLFNRQDTKMWQDLIAKTATTLLFIKGRVKFLNANGTLKGTATCGAVLIAWGQQNAQILKEAAANNTIPGFCCTINQ